MYHRTIYPEPSNCRKDPSTELCQCFGFDYRPISWLKWFKRALGLILVLIAIILLIWNEKRAVDSSRSYHDGMRSITIIKDSEVLKDEDDGKLVHVSGYLKITEALEDLQYGVSIYAIKLKRRVQMYQWIEEKSSPELPGIVKYSKGWRDRLSDSSKFQIARGHENPEQFPIQSETRIHGNVFLGDFKLGPELKDKFINFIEFTSGERPETSEIKMHMGLYYHSADIWNPQVGDVRIQFSFAGQSNSYVSIIAMQSGKELRPFITEMGAEIAFLHEGKRKHEEIFRREHTPIAIQSWMYRVIAYLVATAGSFLGSRIITLISRRNPMIKNLMAMGPQKLSIMLSAFICCSIIGSIWFTHKPIFSFLLITFSCSLLMYYGVTGPHVPKESKVTLPQYTNKNN